MIQERGVIAWMARNPVAANLLMLWIMVAGVKAVFDITKEVFPSFTSETITISVPYPGSSPEEVEQGIIIKIEEAIQDIVGVEEIAAEASEGGGVVTVTIETGEDLSAIINKIKVRVDGIASFPAEAEPAVIEERTIMTRAINVTVFGNVSEQSLKALADSIQDDLLALDSITQVTQAGTREQEISIEINDQVLTQYQLSFAEVVDAIRRQSQDLPAGKLRTEYGNVVLRSIGQAYTAAEFAELTVITTADGSLLRLSDIATVKEGFEDQQILSRLNQMHGITLQIDRVGEQDVLLISQKVKDYVAAKQLELPEGVQLEMWADRTKYLKGRINLMLSSAFQGMLLVILALALFLQLSLAFWVMMGLPFCILGTLFVMDLPVVGLSINIVNLFGFILVIGILVDDAIVTAESAYSQLEEENNGIESVIRGVKRVAVPTIFGVLTTVFAFLPLLLIEEGIGRVMAVMAPSIIIALLFSLLETKLILPAHLGHLRVKNHEKPVKFLPQRLFINLQFVCANGLKVLAKNYYQPFLSRCLMHRYVVLASFIALFILGISLVSSGIVRQVFFPSLPSDTMNARLVLPPGSSHLKTHDYALKIEAAGLALNQRYQRETGQAIDVVVQIHTLASSDTEATIRVELLDGTDRSVSSTELASWWREAIGKLPGIQSFSIEATAGRPSIPIDIELHSSDLEQLRDAAQKIREELVLFSGVFDVRDTFGHGGAELEIQLTQEGEALGLGQVDLARQVREAFFGAEVQRIQRGRHEVRVYLRFPESERDTVSTLESMWIQLADGRRVPFDVVGRVAPLKGVSAIHRLNRQRIVNVQADVDKQRVSPSEILTQIEADILPMVLAQYPKVRYRLTGEAEEQQENIASLMAGSFIMLLLIYAALAIPLKSYGLPFLIMSVIPFGLVGAILGHFVLAKPMSVSSLIGIVALSGIVINDSLVLVDYVRQRRASGISWRAAVEEAGGRRFRAVVLTSLTTFAGLLPIQLETSLQAQFLKPMAISVSFGVLFSTLVTLILVPVLCYIVDDLRLLGRSLMKPIALSKDTL